MRLVCGSALALFSAACSRGPFYFATPSGRRQCAIVPRAKAGCQNATAPTSAIAIAGAPDEVPGTDGEPTAANAIVVDRTADSGGRRLPLQRAGGLRHLLYVGAPADVP